MPKYIHSMIRVFDLDASLRFYRDGLGLRESHRLDFPTFTLVYLRDPESGFEIELTLNKDRTTPYTHGDGYGHVAFCTEDLAGTREHFVRLGATLGDIKSLNGPDGQPAARFFFVTDPDGYKIEVLEKAGHYV